MFVQHTFIEESHKPTLETIIRHHAGITEPYLAKFYRAALDVFANLTEAKAQPSMIFSRFQGGDCVIASVTDERTGFFMQLAGAATPGKSHKNQLTVGEKWVMQGSSETLSTMATKVW